MRASFLIAGVAVALAVIFALRFWPGFQEDSVESAMPAAVPEANVTAADDPNREAIQAVAPPQQPEPVLEATLPSVVLPPLESSDAFVREQVADWLLPDTYLSRKDLIARASVVLHNAAQGQVPRRQLAFLAPPEPYTVVQQGKQFYVDLAAYDRYTPLIDLLERIPAAQLAQKLRMFEPLLREALGQLGERRQPQGLVAQAITRVQNLPVLPERIELVRPNVMYLYADPELEALPELEKQLLRMGPDNLERLQVYLEQFNQHY